MPLDQHPVSVVHSGPPELRVRKDESTRLYDIKGDSKTGGEPHYCAGVLRNIRLIQREAHAYSMVLGGA
jgi:hypothetical protein